MSALKEMGRVARPHGTVLIRDLIRPETPTDAQTFVDRYAADDTPLPTEIILRLLPCRVHHRRSQRDVDADGRAGCRCRPKHRSALVD